MTDSEGVVLLKDALWAATSPLLLEVAEHYPFSAKNLSLEMLALSAEQRGVHYERLIAEVEALKLRSHFLGIRFEQVYQAALKASGSLELLQANWQVQQAGHTFGEFDVLLRSGDTVVHQELAVKFYLGLPAISGAEQTWAWFGPELRDRLDMKLALLMQRQLLLAETEEGAAALSALGIESVRSELVMKGFLFYPLVEQQRVRDMDTELFGEIKRSNSCVSADHLRGYWATLGDLQQMDDADSRWAVLPKSQWLHAAEQSAGGCFRLKEIIGQLKGMEPSGRPVMAARLSSARSDGVRRENLRCFVVPADWASSAAASLHEGFSRR